MLLRQLIPLLADVIATSGRPLSPTQRHMINVLNSFPEFLDDQLLDLFEAKFPLAVHSEDGVTNQLLQGVFDLACFNLYTRFDGEKTLSCFQALARCFDEQGLSAPECHVINNW